MKNNKKKNKKLSEKEIQALRAEALWKIHKYKNKLEIQKVVGRKPIGKDTMLISLLSTLLIILVFPLNSGIYSACIGICTFTFLLFDALLKHNKFYIVIFTILPIVSLLFIIYNI